MLDVAQVEFTVGRTGVNRSDGISTMRVTAAHGLLGNEVQKY
jgi:hypothetical protein